MGAPEDNPKRKTGKKNDEYSVKTGFKVFFCLFIFPALAYLLLNELRWHIAIWLRDFPVLQMASVIALAVFLLLYRFPGLRSVFSARTLNLEKREAKKAKKIKKRQAKLPSSICQRCGYTIRFEKKDGDSKPCHNCGETVFLKRDRITEQRKECPFCGYAFPDAEPQNEPPLKGDAEK